MHFNNESAFKENATGGSADIVRDFSPDVNSERATSVRNNGTTKNGATINKTNYKFGGGAGTFDGSNDWVNLSDIDVQSSGTGFSVELWAKHTATSFRLLVGKRDAGTTNGEWNFAINNAGNDLSFNTWVTGDTNNNLVTGNVGINNNNWHHLVATFNPSDGVKKIYVDGVQVATSTTTSGTPAGTSASLMIGQVQQYYGV
ncbi:MAG: LamG domain-containing protein [Nanoarchaeota archaeon]